VALKSNIAGLIVPQAIRGPAFLKEKKTNVQIKTKKEYFIIFNNYPVVLLSGKPP
jgi:hypothetical protein